MTRPPFMSRKATQIALAKGEQHAFTFGGKTAEDMFKAPVKVATKSNKELLADKKDSFGREVSHLMN